MGKLKMWNISKTADRRVKRSKFGTGATTVDKWRLPLMPDFLNLVWGPSVYSATFSIFPFLKLLSQFSSDSSRLYTRYPYHGAIQAFTFLAICQKLKKKYGIFKFSGPYAAGNLKL